MAEEVKRETVKAMARELGLDLRFLVGLSTVEDLSIGDVVQGLDRGSTGIVEEVGPLGATILVLRDWSGLAVGEKLIGPNLVAEVLSCAKVE